MNILITGKPGCGKSTLVNKLIKKLQDKNITGIITPEIRRNNIRTGFKIINLNTNDEEILASISIKSPFKVGKYCVNVKGIDKIVNIFLEDYEKAEFIFIDELGKMEMFSNEFKRLINKIFNNDKINMITIGLKYLKDYKNKGKIFYLEKNNFDNMLSEILNSIKINNKK